MEESMLRVRCMETIFVRCMETIFARFVQSKVNSDN